MLVASPELVAGVSVTPGTCGFVVRAVPPLILKLIALMSLATGHS